MNDVKTSDEAVTENVISDVFSEAVIEDEVATANGGNGNGKNRFKLDTKTISKLKEWTFLFFVVGIAIIQFAIMWFGVKFNSILLAFQEYNKETFKYNWVGLKNFKDIFHQIFESHEILKYWGRSALIYLVNLSMFPIHILTSYCIWKKVPFSNFFKIFYFIPSILPGMVFPMFFKYFLQFGIAEYWSDAKLVFDATALNMGTIDPQTTVNILMAWNCIQGFAGGMVLYLGTISSVNESVVEYGKLDGLGAWGEFLHIIMPHIWPLFSVQIIAGVVGCMTSDVGLLAYFGGDKTGGGAPKKIWTIGYMMQFKTLEGQKQYGWLSAFGLLLSAIAIPLTFTVRRFMEKWGPSED